MKCPTCKDVTLVMTERNGIEIDYCPQCRGVWLDRGELDKLLEKAAAQSAPAPVASSPAAPQRAPAPQASYPHPDFVDSDFRHRQSGYGYKRRKSWLSDIFD